MISLAGFALDPVLGDASPSRFNVSPRRSVPFMVTEGSDGGAVVYRRIGGWDGTGRVDRPRVPKRFDPVNPLSPSLSPTVQTLPPFSLVKAKHIGKDVQSFSSPLNRPGARAVYATVDLISRCPKYP